MVNIHEELLKMRKDPSTASITLIIDPSTFAEDWLKTNMKNIYNNIEIVTLQDNRITITLELSVRLKARY